MSKKRLAALGASAASAALVGSALFAPAAFAQDAQQAEPSPSAYAIGASGLINIAKTPHQVGSAGTDRVVSIPGHPLVEVEALKASSNPGEASSKVLGLKALGTDAAPVEFPGVNFSHVIEADVLKATCSQGDVSSKIVDLTIAGKNVPIDTAPNTEVIPEQLNGVVKINANQQIDNADGSTTVNAVSISVLDAAKDPTKGVPVLGKLAGQTITLASATCAPQEGGDTTPPDNGGDDGDNEGDNGGNGGADDAGDNGLAPQPEPQPGHISVTG